MAQCLIPQRPAHPCRKLGCPALVRDSGYCERHRRSCDHKRGSSASRGYNARWQSYVRWYLGQEENQFCRICLKQDVLEKSECVDHIVPVRGQDDPLFWDPTNHQPLSNKCHSRKTATEDGGFGR